MGIIFISYALHVRYLPFLDPLSPEAVNATGTRGAIASGVKLIYVRCVPGAWVHNSEGISVPRGPVANLSYVFPQL